MNIIFIFVVYRNIKHIENNITSIQNNKGFQSHNTRICIIDNSVDNSYNDTIRLISMKLGCQYIENIINEGYFSAINTVLNNVDIKIYDYIVIGNDDLIFNNDFLVNLYSHQVLDDVYAIAPNIIRKIDGVHQNPHVIKNLSRMRIFFYDLYFSNIIIAYFMSFINKVLSKFNIFRRKDFNEYSKKMYIRMGYGACYVLTKKFFQIIDRLDSPVFLMGEEAILSNQIHARLGKILYDPSLIVYHDEHSSIGKLPSKNLYMITRRSYKIYRKYLF